MARINYKQLNEFIATNVVARFYEARIEKLRKLNLKRDILIRKNPYLFKAKNVTTSEAFIKGALDAFLSSQEETLFGNLMESLAIYVCHQAFGGRKALQGKMKSIDLEFSRNGNYYVVGIKSGPNWGNRDQIDRMRGNFKAAVELLRQQNVKEPIMAVNGCIYGKESHPHKKDADDPEKSYYKLCGQEFWELISGDNDLYIKIIEPVDTEAKKRDEDFQNLYVKRINEMTLEFSQNFLKKGVIDWKKLIEFVSKKRA